MKHHQIPEKTGSLGGPVPLTTSAVMWLRQHSVVALFVALFVFAGCSKGRSVEGDWLLDFEVNGGPLAQESGDTSTATLTGGKAVWKVDLALNQGRREQYEYRGTYAMSGEELHIVLTLASTTSKRKTPDVWKTFDLKGVPQWSGDDRFSLEALEGKDTVAMVFTRAKR